VNANTKRTVVKRTYFIIGSSLSYNYLSNFISGILAASS
jgi:hypothetical protein